MGYVVGLSITLASVANPIAANEALAQKHNCLLCHAVDKKVVGPAYKDIAAKYKGDPKALDTLVKKVKNGGSGVWGNIPMPPNSAVPDEDIKTLVQWILSLQ
ncbi:MAG TPA: c-type cytochrome [Gammaproteobacteria bacterium]|nr:c-type cytochrome [Gammaproteobacteria bacterium]